MKPSQQLASFKNPKIQFVRELLSDSKTRAEAGLFVVEGVRLAEEAINSHLKPRTVYFSSTLSDRGGAIVRHCQEQSIEVLEMAPDLMDRLSDTETSQGILLTFPQETQPLPARADLVLIIDQLRDPGNMGTILRSAAAVAAGAVFIAPASVDPFMPKVVRAGMGAHFHLPVIRADWAQITHYCKEARTPPLRVFLAEAENGKNMWQADLSSPLALIIGSEAQGAGDQARALADEPVSIPMPGDFESLNAGVAASLLLYEIIRQRNK